MTTNEHVDDSFNSEIGIKFLVFMKLYSFHISFKSNLPDSFLKTMCIFKGIIAPKLIFPFRISPVNVNKSEVKCRFVHSRLGISVHC